MYTCLNNIHPTIEEVRVWAYNDDLLFTEQDEDLILYGSQYVPILMELASEPECPKGYYCFNILISFCQDVLAYRRLQTIEEIEKIVASFAGTVTTELEEWKSDFFKFADIAKYARPVSETEAADIASFLLAGSRVLKFDMISRSNSVFVQYAASSDSFHAYCYVCKETGFWEVGKSEFQEADMKWFRQII